MFIAQSAGHDDVAATTCSWQSVENARYLSARAIIAWCSSV